MAPILRGQGPDGVVALAVDDDGRAQQPGRASTPQFQEDMTEEFPVLPPGQELVATEPLPPPGGRDQPEDLQGNLPSKDAVVPSVTLPNRRGAVKERRP